MNASADALAWDELRRVVRELDPALAQRIGAEWARDAQFEHASIASFGRFALELLAVAAPSDLLESAHRAAIDEIEHARLCFSLASIYTGSPLGPGALPLDARAFTTPDLLTLTHATVLEGCVNETLAAFEAQTAQAHAGFAAVRGALSAIERQESDHASLAFRFVSWAIAVGGARVRQAARDAFVLAERRIRDAALPESADAAAEQALLSHGRMPARRRAELRRRVLSEVIAPAAQALLRAGE
ncbi:MAG TPA: hypothetical protein VI072_25355 [Polyangiaceae bacterium]